jgi:hypothetical protein
VAYLRDLPKPTCCNCGARASVALYNRVNAPLGNFCRQCARHALKEQARREREGEGSAKSRDDLAKERA